MSQYDRDLSFHFSSYGITLRFARGAIGINPSLVEKRNGLKRISTSRHSFPSALPRRSPKGGGGPCLAESAQGGEGGLFVLVCYNTIGGGKGDALNPIAALSLTILFYRYL